MIKEDFAVNPPHAKRLGRGLSALISASSDLDVNVHPETQDARPGPAGSKALARVDQLRPNPMQPRREFQPAQLQALADSIRNNGLLQPLLVRQAGKDVFEIIAGERRWRAAQMAGLSEVPVAIRQASDEEMLELALIENIHREDLNPIERAAAYRRYCDQYNLTAEDVAQRLGEDRSTVANYLRLLGLPPDVQNLVAGGSLSMGHARCLLGLRHPSQMTTVAREVIDKGLSVRATEALVRQLLASRSAASRESSGEAAKRPQIRNLEQAFGQALGTKVEICESRRRGSGRITIHYYNLDDFDRISTRLGIRVD